MPMVSAGSDRPSPSRILAGDKHLRRLFAALTEHTFQTELGVADPPLTDYLADLLFRFVRMDAVYRLRDSLGRRIEEVAEMLLAAEERPERPRREIHRHIGDITLFWTGVYPEFLARLRSPLRKDHLLDYAETGKRSYYLAGRSVVDEDEDEAAVLLRLSELFELCSSGLRRVREEWEQLAAA